MGVVYLARDSRLDRQVAIKALPVELASDPARLERFEREAKTLASLNHPNIAGIHGVEEHEGSRYLVLEYVEGETLAEMLDRGALPVDEAIEIAVQIAAGVETAHEAGVIHRDLKPGNVIVTPEGKAKVLDFGLARVEETSSSSTGGMSESPTLTSPAIQHSPTMPGVILGTAAYMSPEQARGRRVDKRTDIWSFGVVLYEMLTGASPFLGETVTDSIGAVLHKELDFASLPAGTPGGVLRALERCLQRKREERWRDIGDVRIELMRRDEPVEAPAPVRGPRAASMLLVALLCAVVGAGAWLAGAAMRATPVATPGPMHLAIPKRVSGDAPIRTLPNFAVAHPTRRVVFIGDDGAGGAQRLFVRSLDRPEARPIPGVEHVTDVTISPDGRTVLFIWNDPDSRNEELRRVSIDGGPVTTLLSADDGPGFDLDILPVWLSPTSVALADGNRLVLYRLSLENLETSPLLDITEFVDGSAFVLPWSALSDGRTLLVTVGMVDPTRGPVMDLYALDLVERQATRIVNNAVAGFVFDGGRRIAFGRLSDATLCVARFDMATKTVVGEFMPLLARVGDADISPEGDLYYTTTSDRAAGVRPVAIGLDGAREPLIERRLFLEPFVHLSPDGGSLGLTTAPEPEGPPTAEILDLDTGFVTPVVDGPIVTGAPMWMSDGVVVFMRYETASRIELQRIRLGLETQGTPIAPLGPGGGAQLAPDFSPDGRWMAYQFSEGFESPVRSLYIVAADEPGEPRPLVRSGAVDTEPAFSPNGQWLAYFTDTAGENRVVMRRFDTRTGTVESRIIPVSQGPGMNPVWSPDGAFLYFIDPAEGSIKRVAVEYEPALRLAPPEVALTSAQLEGLAIVGPQSIDIFPDGERFVAIESPPETGPAPPYINVTLNWLAELDRLMPLDEVDRRR